MDSHHHVLLLRLSSPRGLFGQTGALLSCIRLLLAHLARPRVPHSSYSPIFLGDYGFDVYYCWFNSPNPNVQFGMKMAYYFGPLWVLFLLEVFWAAQTFHKLKRLGLESR